MTAARLPFDFYYSFRSPYSYLAISLIEREMQKWALRPRMRIVLPIAVRIPGFFKTVNPMWPPYLMRDTWRISEFNQIPYAWPKPDPIVMDISTGEVPTEQPYIYRVSRLGVLAEEAGKGVEFVAEAARAIWSGKIQNWHEGGHLERALEQSGLPPSLDQRALEEAARLDAVIAENEAAQKAAGHWGVPLFVFKEEPFFGQDRIELLIWKMRQAGLQPA